MIILSLLIFLFGLFLACFLGYAIAVFGYWTFLEGGKYNVQLYLFRYLRILELSWFQFLFWFLAFFFFRFLAILSEQKYNRG